MTVDWRELRRRVEAAMAATDASRTSDPAATLQARARHLARAREELEHAAEDEMVELTIGGQRCAIEARFVAAVLRPLTLTSIPGVGPALLGIARVRGAILAVFDLGIILFDRPTVQGPESRIVALGADALEVGILVESVDRVAAGGGEIAAPAGGELGGLVRGTMRDGRTVLSGAALLADRRLFVDASGVPGD